MKMQSLSVFIFYKEAVLAKNGKQALRRGTDNGYIEGSERRRRSSDVFKPTAPK
jgi:hypothetical protein